MLPSNIETEVKKILKKAGGWLRVEECAKEYAKGNSSERTKFYRWRKQIEKDKVKGLQILELPGNVVFIGLKGADPSKVLNSIISDGETTKKMRGFFSRFKHKKGKKLFGPEELLTLPIFLQDDNPYIKNYAKLYIWLRRGARPEEYPELDKE